MPPSSRRRSGAVALAALLLVAACGDTDDGGDGAGTSASGSAPTTGNADGATATLVDALGEVTVPVTDTGVYALDEFAAISLLSLGVTPSMTETFFDEVTLRPVLDETGAPLAPPGSIEAIAAAAPELILGIGHPNHLEVAEEHRGIAPAAYPDFTASWSDQTLAFAAAVGRTDRAEAVLAAIDARVDEVAGLVDDAGLSGARASVIGGFDGTYFAYGPTTIGGVVLDRLGFVRSDAQSGVENFGFLPISEELLPEETDADLVLSITSESNGYASVFENPVVDVSGTTSADVDSWWGNNSALGAWAVLADLEAILTGGTPTTADDAVRLWGELLAAIETVESDERIDRDARTATTYPVTIEHKFGSTTVENEPERVVSVGFNEHDFLLAIGVVPVGLRDWYGDQPNSVWSWAQDELGDATPAIIGDGSAINYEAIAALDPDLIVGIWSGMTDAEYELLAAIAPTIAQPGEYVDYGTPWQEQTEILGLVTGRTEAAADAVARIDDRIAAVRDAHPEWEGLTATVAFFFGEQPGAYNTTDPRSRLLADLGFTIPPRYDEGDTGFYEVSAENLDLIDTDLLIWVAGDESEYPALVDALPTRQTTRAFAEGREVFASTDLTGAFSHSSPLSLEFVLDELVDEIEVAVDGDPTTVVPSAARFGTVDGG